MRLILLMLALTGWAVGQPITQSQKDSGWVSLFDGKTLNGFYSQFGSQIDTNPGPTVKAFSVNASDTTIAATGSPIGIVTTKKNYSHYRVRIWIKFGNTSNSSDNAGMLYHVQKGSPLLFGLYPRSIEFQGQKSGIGDAWTIGNVWITVKVVSTLEGPKYSPTGRDSSVGDPGRQCLGIPVRYKEGKWNVMDLTVRGSDSAIYTVNDTVTMRLRKMRWSEQDSPTDMSHPLASGGISFQSEGAPVAYTHLMIMELDPVTGKPINGRPVSIAPPARPAFPGPSLAGGQYGMTLQLPGTAAWEDRFSQGSGSRLLSIRALNGRALRAHAPDSDNRRTSAVAGLYVLKLSDSLQK